MTQSGTEQGSTRRAEQEMRAAAGGWPEGLDSDPHPSLSDLAEGLGITVGEARALLTEVRTRRLRKTRHADAPPALRPAPGPPRPGTRGVTELGALIALMLLIACALGNAVAAAL